MLRWAKRHAKKLFYKNVVKHGPWLDKLLISLQLKYIFEELEKINNTL